MLVSIICLIVLTFIMLNNKKRDKIRIQNKQDAIEALTDRIYLLSNTCCNRQLSPKISLMDINNNQIYLEQIINTPKIVLYANKFQCQDCVKEAFKEYIERIKNRHLAKYAIILTENYNLREIKLMFDSHNFNLPVFILNSSINSHLYELRLIGKPYFFYINKTFEISNLWFPHSGIDSLINTNYFNLLYDKLKSSKSNFPKKDNFKIINPVINIGKVRINQKNNIQFELVNLGKMPCLIESIKSSCGCLIPKIDFNLLEPDSIKFINVIFTPTTKGYFSKTVTVKTNSKVDPFKQMWINGYAE